MLFQIVHDLLHKFSVGSGSAQVACFKSVMVANGQRGEPFLDLSAQGNSPNRCNAWHNRQYANGRTMRDIANLTGHGD